MTTEAYRRNFAGIKWLPIETRARPKHETRGRAPTFMPDIAEFISPIDRSRISSRSQIREHERRHGVRQVGELKTPQDFDNSHLPRERYSERALEAAFRAAVQRTGLTGD